MIKNPLILYDGVCNLCNRWVQFVLRHDRREQFSFAPLQGTTARKFISDSTPAQIPDSVILIDNNIVYTGSSAALRIFKILGGGWALLYSLIIVPQFLREGVYRFVAKRRYKWFGKTESCMLPPESSKHRFLD